MVQFKVSNAPPVAYREFLEIIAMPKKVYIMSEPAADATDAEKAAFVSAPIGLKFEFEDKTEMSVDFSKLSQDIKIRAMFHGISQKVGDSYAGAAKAEEGALAYAKRAVSETLAQLYAGDWRSASEGGPKAPSDLAVAMARVSGKTPEACQAFVGTLTDEEKKTWRKKAKIAAALATIAAEKAKARAEKLAKAAENTAPSGTSDEEEIEIPEVGESEG